MANHTIIEKHYPQINSHLIETETDNIKCIKCGSYNTSILPTNSGGSKLICNNCGFKEKSIPTWALGIVFISVLILIFFF